MKTEMELINLKKSWLINPSYDLYLEDGFEAHAEELFIFQIEELIPDTFTPFSQRMAAELVSRISSSNKV